MLEHFVLSAKFFTMKTILIFSCTILMVLFSLKIDANSQEYVITGQCLTASSPDTGIGGVDITVTSHSASLVYTGETDRTGTYRISVQPFMNYTVTATYDNSSQSKESGVITNNITPLAPFYFSVD